MNTKQKMISVVAVAAAAFSAQASAYTELFFNQHSGFEAPTSTTAGLNMQLLNPTGGDPYPADTYETLSWRFPGLPDYSSLSVDSFTSEGGPSAGNVLMGDTNANGRWNAGEWFTISRLTHTNNVINGSGNPLWIADVVSSLDIYLDAARTQLLVNDLGSETIRFAETFNNSSCALNSGVYPGSNCDDIYRSALSAFAPIYLPGGGYLEFTLAAPVGLDPSLNLPGYYNPYITISPTEFVVYTPEYAPGITVLDVQMRWVPEPGTLALLGIGLMGLGLSARRKV
jgi:hypothetical protein